MHTMFIQPRFVGGRFDEHTLPLSLAKDLVAYEELVIELGKVLFLRNNPKRMRAANGFESSFRLHIKRIDHGCARPAMVVPGGELAVEFSEARELINRVIDSPVLPSEFPKPLLRYFDRIGRSLEEGESIEWDSASATNKAVLTQARRRELVLSLGGKYDDALILVGVVEELRQGEAVLRVADSDDVSVKFDERWSEEWTEKLRAAWKCPRTLVRIVGTGVFDRHGRLSTVKEITTLECQANSELVTRIDSLAELRDGWLEGHGRAFDVDELQRLSAELAKTFPPSLPYPSVAPTEEGHVALEWIRERARIELEVNFTDNKLELYATDLADDSFVEASFERDQWKEALDQVAEILGR